ncbi:MAG: MBL fold metallo-hydrolase [Candidatus Aenigmarchaeota archaeon]|nr:MBL fold metallo-hydrolase [Candidatus Aenigmarchaeota archaeon]
MDTICFVGTGGGRMATITQLRKTAGIFLELKGAKIYLDPGPGAIVHARAEKLPLEKIDCVLLSHKHIDHTNDAEVLIEAMTKGVRENKGILAAPKSTISELTEYHQAAPKKIIKIKPGDKFNIGDLNIESTKTTHTDKDGVGFKFFASKKISYVGDTVYSKDIARQHKGADILILNCLYLVNDNKGKDVEFAKHMDLADAIKFVRDIKPKLCILQHFGMGMILKKPWEKAKEVEDATGVKTIAARDGQVFDVSGTIKKETKGLEKFAS